MLEGICMCFYKAIVQSMFKHVPSVNGPLVLKLQSYSQIFIVLINLSDTKDFSTHIGYRGGGGGVGVTPLISHDSLDVGT